jgi:hypothetical protein
MLPQGFKSRERTPVLMEEHRSRMFENEVLRRIFGSNREELTRRYKNFSFIIYSLHEK